MHKILAIDDDGLLLGTFLHWLEGKGFQAIGAHNSLLGFQLAKKLMPDLIICALRRPELSRYHDLIALRQDPVTQKIPLILITAKQTDYECRRARELGADDYLIKPLKTGELSKAIKAQLEQINQVPLCSLT
jgi:DNA-binding response OmpR family regulator